MKAWGRGVGQAFNAGKALGTIELMDWGIRLGACAPKSLSFAFF